MTDYQNNVASKMSKMLEDTISEALIKAVQNLSIEIDEEELLKMLRDSKEQYKRGYEAREQEIVRCKNCNHYRKDTCSACAGMAVPPPEEWYCADGERR